MKYTFALLVSAFLLAGCGSLSTKPQTVITHQDFVKTLDPQLLQRCPALPVPASTSASSGDLLGMYGSLQGQYSRCALKDDCLIAAVTGELICVQPGKENDDSNSSQIKK